MYPRIRHYFGKRIRVIKQLIPEYHLLIKELSTCDTNKCQRKQKELLILQSHIIEKGLSLKDVRIGFGKPKIKSLLQSLESYASSYGEDKNTVYFVYSILCQYFEYNRSNGYEDKELIDEFNRFSSRHEVQNVPRLEGEIVHFKKSEIWNEDFFDYATFVTSRHSSRQFTGRPIDRQLLEKALAIAENTPSACNRQPWRNYVFFQRDNIDKILEIQSGARQFKNDVAALILVTSTPNAFSETELHQLYVNGGLYAMNLLLSLHSVGLGCIPLNLGLGKKNKQLSEVCGIDHSDVPVMLIAIGDVPEEFNVAKSCKFSYSDYSVFDI